MNGEPYFLLESMSRWDFGWRLSQTEGPILLPIPVDFNNTVEAIHHVKRISGAAGCTLMVKVCGHGTDGPGEERVIEIHHRPAASQGVAAH